MAAMMEQSSFDCCSSPSDRINKLQESPTSNSDALVSRMTWIVDCQWQSHQNLVEEEFFGAFCGVPKVDGFRLPWLSTLELSSTSSIVNEPRAFCHSVWQSMALSFPVNCHPHFTIFKKRHSRSGSRSQELEQTRCKNPVDVVVALNEAP